MGDDDFFQKPPRLIIELKVCLILPEAEVENKIRGLVLMVCRKCALRREQKLVREGDQAGNESSKGEIAGEA